MNRHARHGIFLALMGALASCAGCGAERREIRMDLVIQDDHPGREVAPDVAWDNSAPPDGLPTDLHEGPADVQLSDKLVDGDAPALDLADLADRDGALVDSGDLGPDLGDQTDETGPAPDTDEPCHCPAAVGGKIGGMPDCPYYMRESAMALDYFQVLQFVRWEPGLEPGLPEGFSPVGGQVLALVRVRWRDQWNEGGAMFEQAQEVVAELQGVQGCGGHCFLAQNYVWVVDMVSMTLVYAAKEPESTTVVSEMAYCPMAPGAYCLSFAEIGKRLMFVTSGMGQVTGTDNELPDALRVMEPDEYILIQNISVPLF